MTKSDKPTFTDWFMPIAGFAPLAIILLLLVAGRLFGDGD